eukprot:TRINITY_DN40405_c0_g1_i1.p1 TRINITY_DN40405_c0_g1~~TRINITY_DN40405_c0_g1_i1.p1  ORF type:complete len:400 (+),score=60.07 TRINITY_DN40405_c0_g1_i1:37-1236(+)
MASSSPLAEGTRVRIKELQSRPEVNGLEAELGQFSEKDSSYECWLIDDALEGQYVFCKRDQFDLLNPQGSMDTASSGVVAQANGFCAGDRVRNKNNGQIGTVVAVDADGDPKVKFDGDGEALQRFAKDFEIVEKTCFEVGDRVRGTILGKDGVVVAVDADGDPKVRMDGERDALQRFGKEFIIVEKARFGCGDRVRGKILGKDGVVISVDSDGDPKVKLEGEAEALQRFGHEFRIITKATFEIGDRVRHKSTGALGTVMAVDADGDPKVRPDGESDAQQRYGKDYEIVSRPSLNSSGSINVDDLALAAGEGRSRSRSRSGDNKKDKSSKKKKKKSSSSSSYSSKSSSSGSRRKKKSSAFGKSVLEKMAEDKRKARKHMKKHGKHRSSGADAALGLLGLS